MFIDEAEINVKGGHGGAGKVSYFPMKSGPSGGNGGKGGDVYAVVDNNTPDLKTFVEHTSYKGADGGAGGRNKRNGLDAAELHLKVPAGTSIINLYNSKETELNENNRKFLLCKGGRGGYGNESFKSSTNQTPDIAESGFPGEERRFKLILRLIADYGLIGLPNAGKSSLLNVLTNADVKTADYPFTTLEPNLGVYKRKIIADIPGLIEGASAGRGLGYKFLKHIEKVKLLLHCISVESTNLEKDFLTVINEMSSYNKDILNKKSVILLTKTDLINKKELNVKIKELKKFGQEIISISIIDDKSLEILKKIL